MQNVVIVGGGQAGFQAAVSLREEGYGGYITLIGDDPLSPYQRPPLSKGYLLGKVSETQILLRQEPFYVDSNISLLLNRSVEGIDRRQQRVRLSSGEHLAYDRLVLATGCRGRALEIPGADFAAVQTLKTLADARRLRARLAGTRSLTIIGGGFIGLELACAARSFGIQVHVFESSDRLMKRAVSVQTSSFYEMLHRRNGVEICLEAQVEQIEHTNSSITAVRTSMGTTRSDTVIVGIGVVPNVEIAAAAGLTTADGIVVDERMQTSDPCIYAIGDCANHFNPYFGGRTRLESVQNAVDQARTMAANLCGKQKVYDAVPWFWSDQYDARLQIAACSTGSDSTIMRGSLDQGAFTIFALKEGALVGAESVNRPADHLLCRRLLLADRRPTAGQLRDENVSLKDLLAA